MMSLSAVVARDSRRVDLIDVLEQRRSIGALWLREPGPTPHEVRRLLTVAARVPDHGALAPWRFILVEGDARAGLAERLADAYAAQAGEASPEQVLKTVQKLRALFGQPPLVVVVVSRVDATSRIPEWEQVLSAGAACMNLITAAHALGYGANWLTGWAAYDPAALRILGLGDGERVAGIVPIGTPVERPQDRPRPSLEAVLTTWSE